MDEVDAGIVQVDARRVAAVLVHVEAADGVFDEAVGEFAVQAQLLAPRAVVEAVVELRDRHRRGVLVLAELGRVFAPRADLEQLRDRCRSIVTFACMPQPLKSWFWSAA